MKTILIIIFLASSTIFVVASAVYPIPKTPITIYLPDAAQGSQPLCISNRASFPVKIANGPTLKTGQAVNASVVRDFAWGFTNPATTTDRTDVDCYVIKD